jgi:hypothetical protein
MSKCILSQLDSGRWYCPACDPEKRRTLPVNAHRKCRAAPGYAPADPLTARLAELRLNGQWGVDGATVEARLATCRACKLWHQDHCDHYRGSTTCEQRTRYVAAVAGTLGMSGPKIQPCDLWQDAAAEDWRKAMGTPLPSV